MTIKIDKQEAKKPDELLAGLSQGYNWAIGHRNTVIGLVGLFFIIGLGLTGFQYVKESKEIKAQEQYYGLEKIYFEKKGQFEQALRQEKQKTEDKKENKKNAKADSAVDAKATVLEKATGDLTKDYGTIETQLKEVVAKNPGTQGAAMSALLLSDLYLEYQQANQALELLKSMKPEPGSMMDNLVAMQLGNVQAINNDCQSAISTWSQILQKKDLAYLHDELKFRTAQCQIQLGQSVEAEKTLSEIANNKESMNYSINREAAKYLRLLKVKKNFNGEG